MNIKRRLVQQIRDYAGSFIRPVNLITGPEVVDKPRGDRIVVFSPHFDDDIIGCGGTLYKHVLSGNEVSVIYLTDGREGAPEIHDKNLVGRLRKKEAEKATKIFGIENIFFMDEPETKLSSTDSVVTRLYDVLNKIRPNLIYIPSFIDNHIDHFEANRILFNLSQKLPFNFNVAAYEVWTPLFPNITVDITSVAYRKEEALNQYTTQIRQVDYVSTTMALNRYRSVITQRGEGYAEAFFYAPLKEYTDIMKKLKIMKRVFIDKKSRFG